MPSNSLIRWVGERSAALDEIENAHEIVSESERDRRSTRQQLNHTYVALLSAHFQGFCRDLHAESVDTIVLSLPVAVRIFTRAEFVWNRALARGNPNPGAVGSDFGRLGVGFWAAARGLDRRAERRQMRLEELIAWRNAIAHQDFDPVTGGAEPALQAARVRRWRTALDGLARTFDRVMYNYLLALRGEPPW